MNETNIFTFVYKRMIKLFWTMLGSGFIVFLLTVILCILKLNIVLPLPVRHIWGLILCILTILCGVTSSNLLRIVFQIYATKKKQISMEDFLWLQNMVIIAPLLAPFMACFIFFLLVPQPFLYTSLMAGLYGVYAARPSKRRLALELRYYGLDI